MLTEQSSAGGLRTQTQGRFVLFFATDFRLSYCFSLVFTAFLTHVLWSLQCCVHFCDSQLVRERTCLRYNSQVLSIANLNLTMWSSLTPVPVPSCQCHRTSAVGAKTILKTQKRMVVLGTKHCLTPFNWSILAYMWQQIISVVKAHPSMMSVKLTSLAMATMKVYCPWP